MSRQEYTVSKLYDDLSAIYSCKYGDNPGEKELAIETLTEAVVNGVSATTFITKMRHLKKANGSGEYQSKLVTQILSKFWEKDFIQRLEHRPYKPEIGDFYEQQ